MAKRTEYFSEPEGYGPEEQTDVKESVAQGLWNRCQKYFASPQALWKGAGFLVLAAFLWMILGNFGLVPTGNFPAVTGSKWQAVFLTNGQVFFGRLHNFNREYLLLKDVYYLQIAQPLQQGQEQPQNLNLVKLGSELHGPEDAMFIPKDRMLFWENMKSDAQVVRAILSTRQ